MHWSRGYHALITWLIIHFYFNETYKLIANRGGNNNSIGIESCVNEGTDLYYTWQKTAKLVANLLYKHNLTFDDVKQHHYYSGKDCPQTIRTSRMWDHFMDLVKCEYEACKLISEGYKFRLIPKSSNLLKTGRLTSNDACKFIVEIEKDGIVETLEF